MRATKPKPVTKVPTVKEYATLTAKAQLAAAKLRQETWWAVESEARVLEARRKWARIESEAYRSKHWAELRWPEPHKLGRQRLQMIHDEMDGK